MRSCRVLFFWGPTPWGEPRVFYTNRSGGIQGGISNGEAIDLRVAFKPTATINFAQDTVTREGVSTELRAKGRHDPCVLPRAVSMVEAMINLVLLDHWLRNRNKKFADLAG